MNDEIKEKIKATNKPTCKHYRVTFQLNPVYVEAYCEKNAVDNAKNWVQPLLFIKKVEIVTKEEFDNATGKPKEEFIL